MTQNQITQTATTDIGPDAWRQAARYYASLGFPSLPLRGKLPLTPNGVHDASADPAQHAAWAHQFPGANIGIAIPDGMAVVDVDPRNGGAETFGKLDDVEGAIPKSTLQVQTGGGGLHVFVRVTPGASLPSKLGPGVDVKQLGGYVVAAPSVHPVTGQAYRIVDASPIANAPAALASRLTARGESRAKAVGADEIDEARRSDVRFGMDPDKAVSDVSPEGIARTVEAVAPIYIPGQRHEVRVALGGMLARRGWSAASVAELISQLAQATGSDTSPKVVRECLAGMNYPGGYYKLASLVDAATLEAIDASIPNPYGAELKASRALAREQIQSALAPVPLAATRVAVHDIVASPEKIADLWHELGLADDSDVQPPARIVEGLDIADAQTTGIAGLPNAGKTPTAMSLALCVANGKPWLGRKTEKRPVIYVNFEKASGAILKRQRIARGLGVDPTSVFLLNAGEKGLALNDKSGTPTKLAAAVKQVLEDNGVAPLVFVDTYPNALFGVDHNSAEFAEPLRLLITTIRAVAPCPILPLLHCRKSLAANAKPDRADVEGSGAVVGICDAVIGVYKPDFNDQNVIELTQTRSLAGDLPATRLRWDGSDNEPLVATLVGEREGRGADGETSPRRKKLTDDDRKTQAFQRIKNATETAPLTTVWRIDDLARASQLDATQKPGRDAIKYAAGELVKEGGLLYEKRGRQDAWRRPTPDEYGREQRALTREAQIAAAQYESSQRHGLASTPSGYGSPPTHAGGFDVIPEPHAVPLPGEPTSGAPLIPPGDPAAGVPSAALPLGFIPLRAVPPAGPPHKPFNPNVQ